ncbi:TetR/AcrR family transcriptional regulator [Pantoea sp. BAV 3049]|uniref:TetR/AcrR family transcriptional regulator n=1 Tax=Pantoea sp. BAV 3049 TaxID=2654188 RepID=UPI00131C2A67|nr:TetR/AcrR family transcriptional regulator [Pantoea sp. BAV 3049]
MKPTVGRPREFDPQDLLNTALECFWLHGYRGTSMADLMKASGLASASIYKLYPDKRTIFLAALRQYMDNGLARLEQRYQQLSPEEALKETLSFGVELSTGKAGERGCLTIATANELLPGDDEIRRLVGYKFSGIVRHLTAILVKGQQAGVFRRDQDAAILAETLFMLLEGMRVYGKIQPDSGMLAQVNSFVISTILSRNDNEGSGK